MKLNLETHSQSDEIIKAFLEENASDILAEKINNGVIIEKDGKRLLNKKSLSTFMKYATEEARKLSEKGASSSCIKDDVFFGWAIHYFEEESIVGTLYNDDGSTYKQSKTAVKTTYTPTSAPAVKKQEPQLSLFDMIGCENKNEEKVAEPEDEESNEEPTEEELDEAFKNTLAEDIKEEKPINNRQSKGNPFYERYKESALKYSDGIVCLRLGDFYEILGKKASVAAECLTLTLTSRDCGLERRLPMCGFPYHCADAYISKLVSAGHKVVVVENMTESENVERVIEKSIEKEKTIVDIDTGEILNTDKISNDLSTLFGNNIVEVD